MQQTWCHVPRAATFSCTKLSCIRLFPAKAGQHSLFSPVSCEALMLLCVFLLKISPECKCPFKSDGFRALSPLCRYAVLCGQLSEHESIQKRIQTGYVFKVSRKDVLAFVEVWNGSCFYSKKLGKLAPACMCMMSLRT